MEKPIIGGIFGTRTEWDAEGNMVEKDEFHLRIYWDLFRSGAITRLKGNMLHVYLTIAMHLDKKGEGWPTQEQIAEYCGINRTTVVTSIKKLVNEGFIEAEKVRLANGNWDNTRYKIKFAPNKKEGNNHVEKSNMEETPQNQGSDHVEKINMEKSTWKNQHDKSNTKKELSFKKDLSFKKEPSIKKEPPQVVDYINLIEKEFKKKISTKSMKKLLDKASAENVDFGVVIQGTKDYYLKKKDKIKDLVAALTVGIEITASKITTSVTADLPKSFTGEIEEDVNSLLTEEEFMTQLQEFRSHKY